MDDEQVPERGVVPSPPRRSLSYDDLDLGERIGRGGNADVRVATVATDDGSLRVAVKEPRFEGTLERGTAAGFEREVEAWAELADHEGVVGVVDWGSQPVPWLALEYMDGGSLADRLAGTEGGLPPTQAAWTGVRIASAVRYAHRHGLAHLDLKPANVLLRTVDGAWDVPKVTDWGLARFLLDHSGSVEGLSPRYAAPEQFDADAYGDPDDFTDIYGVGAVVYELLTGRPPFDGSGVAVMQSVLNDEPAPPTDIDPTLPTVADEVLGRALATEKADRHETAVHLREDLERLCEAARENGAGAEGDEIDTGSTEPSGTEAGESRDSAEFDWPYSRAHTRKGDDESLPEFQDDEGSAAPDPLAEHPARSAVERHADLDEDVWAPVLEGLDADPSSTSPFRVTVDEASTVEGDAVLNGRVAAGDSAATAPAGLEGTSVTIQPSGATGTVSSLLRNGTLDDFADAGDEVTIGVEGIDADDVRRGDVCGPADDPPTAVESFTARLHVLDHPSVITAGYTPVVHAHTAQVASTFETLHEKRAAPRATAALDPDYIESGDLAEVTLTPQQPLVVASVAETPELSTFTVRDMGQAIAVGVVTEVTPE